jgi:hypothetical protein
LIGKKNRKYIRILKIKFNQNECTEPARGAGSRYFCFVLGGVWYSPALLGKTWMKETNLTDDDTRQVNKGKIFSLSLLLSLARR